MFCLDIHNESVKALKYPSAESKAATEAAKDKAKEEKKPGQDDKVHTMLEWYLYSGCSSMCIIYLVLLQLFYALHFVDVCMLVCADFR